jgi:porin
MRRIFTTMLSLVVVNLATTFPVNGQATAEQRPWTDSISTPKPSRFGGPDSVGGTIERDREARDSGFTIPGLQEAWDGWFEWKDRVQEEHGLALGFDYTAAILGATESLTNDEASGGTARFFGFWELSGRDTPNVGAFIWKLEHRHRYGEIAPAGLASSVGYAGEFEGPFTDEGLRFTNLYWRQQISGDRAMVVGGFLDITDYLETYPLASAWTGFMNFAFDSGSATMGLPDDATLGIAGSTMLGKNFYVLAGLTNANADPEDPFSEVGSFFDTNEYFTSVELGWTVSEERRDFDNAHLTLWHLDSRHSADEPGGWGAAFSVVRYLGERWMPFVRGGYSDDGGAFLERSISAGLGFDAVPDRDLLGVGFNWGRPNKSRFGPGLRDQYTVELFYRMNITGRFAITPDIQFIKNPALNPAVDSLWVLGLRARLAI